MMRGKGKLSRRQFISRGMVAAGSLAGFPHLVRSSALGLGGTVSASERITVGLIGLGIRGTSHLRTLLGHPEAQIIAVCDLYRSRREKAKNRVEDGYGGKTDGSYRGCETYRDFRELLAREDVDAVVVSTPEHWHGLTMIAAVRAGKDVYGEKALTLTVAEGRRLCEEVRRFGRVFQVGTQQRSRRDFRFACELARNGYLGKVHTVEVGVPGGHALPDSPPTAVPAGFDYEMWLGPAPVKPYNAIRCTSPEGWYHIYDYCAGWIQSWGVHHMDIALWGVPGLGSSPLEVEGAAVFPARGLGNTSLTWRVEFVSSDGVRLSFSDNARYEQGCRFKGDEGWVHVNRGGIRAEPASLLKVSTRPGEQHLYESNNHHANFLECVRSRREPAARVEAGHAATTATLVADVATRIGRKAMWNWQSESFVNDEQANRMLERTMRSPWRL